MTGAHHRQFSRAAVEMGIAGRQILLLAQNLPHHRVDAAHGVLRRIERPRVLAQQGFDGGGEESRAGTVPAHVGHKVAGDIAIDGDHIVKVSTGLLERLILHRKGGFRVVFGASQDGLLRLTQALQAGPLFAHQRAVVLRNPQMNPHPGEHFLAIDGLGNVVAPPILRPFTLLATSSRPERKMIGMSEVSGSDFNCEQVSNPVSPGMMTSSRIKSGRSVRLIALAVAPSRATTVTNPSGCKMPSSKRTLTAASSTMSIFGDSVNVECNCMDGGFAEPGKMPTRVPIGLKRAGLNCFLAAQVLCCDRVPKGYP